MPDDFTQAATGPLQGGGGQGVTPPQSFGLRQLLEIAIPALAATAGTSKWAGPGAALTRGAVAGLAGYESQQPKALTTEDQYHLAAARRYEALAQERQWRLQNQDEYARRLSAEERAKFYSDPQGYLKRADEQPRREIAGHTLTELYGIPPEVLAGMDTKGLEGLLADSQKGGKPIREQQPDGSWKWTWYGPRGDKLKVGGPAPAPTEKSDDARLDRSYQQRHADLTKVVQPIEAQGERLGRLIESVNQRSPQADSLIAPELLTAMAGGQGSGLRMTEAEIRRIVGGRSNWEGIQAAVNKWKGPGDALSITDAQREQVNNLIRAMHDKIQKKLKLAYDAFDALTDTKSVEEQRRIVDKARREMFDDMGTVGKPGTASGTAPAPSGSDVLNALGLPPPPGGAGTAAPQAAAPSPGQGGSMAGQLSPQAQAAFEQAPVGQRVKLHGQIWIKTGAGTLAPAPAGE